MQGTWKPSLVEELRSHMSRGSRALTGQLPRLRSSAHVPVYHGKPAHLNEEPAQPKKGSLGGPRGARGRQSPPASLTEYVSYGRAPHLILSTSALVLLPVPRCPSGKGKEAPGTLRRGRAQAVSPVLLPALSLRPTA